MEPKALRLGPIIAESESLVRLNKTSATDESKAVPLGLVVTKLKWSWVLSRRYHHSRVEGSLIGPHYGRFSYLDSLWPNWKSCRGQIIDFAASERKTLQLGLVIDESEKTLRSNGRYLVGQIEGSLTGPRYGRIKEVVATEWRTLSRIN